MISATSSAIHRSIFPYFVVTGLTLRGRRSGTTAQYVARPRHRYRVEAIRNDAAHYFVHQVPLFERPMSAIITTDPIETNGEPSDPPERTRGAVPAHSVNTAARRRRREHSRAPVCRSDTSSSARSGRRDVWRNVRHRRDVAAHVVRIVAFTVAVDVATRARIKFTKIPARIVLSGSRCARSCRRPSRSARDSTPTTCVDQWAHECRRPRLA